MFYSYDKLIEFYPNDPEKYKLKGDHLITRKGYDKALFLFKN